MTKPLERSRGLVRIRGVEWLELQFIVSRFRVKGEMTFSRTNLRPYLSQRMNDQAINVFAPHERRSLTG
jgi:hypothetical protein